MNSKIALPNSRQESLSKPLVYATWVQNVPLRQLSDSSSVMATKVYSNHHNGNNGVNTKTTKRPKVTSQSSNSRSGSACSLGHAYTSNYGVVNTNNNSNNNNNNNSSKKMTTLRQTLLSFPTENIVKSYQPQHLINTQSQHQSQQLQQQQQPQTSSTSYLPRPPSLIYESKRMAYRYNKSTSVEESILSNNEAYIYESVKDHNNAKPNNNNNNSNISSLTQTSCQNCTKSTSFPVSSRLNNMISTESVDNNNNDDFLSNFSSTKPSKSSMPNYSKTFAQTLHTTFQLNSIDCLSIRPIIRYTNSNSQTRYDNSGFRRVLEVYPYRDPLVKATKSFISRMTEIALLTQNTIRLEKSKKKGNGNKKSTTSDNKSN